MQFLVIYSNGKSQAFYTKDVAEMYRNINGGFVVNLIDSETLDNSTEVTYTDITD